MFCLSRPVTLVFHYQLQNLLARIAIVYGLTFLFVLPLLCHNLPYSKYFTTSRNLEKRVLLNNQERVTAAEKYLSTLEKNGPSKAKPKSGELRIAIGVISVSRQTKSFSTQYLTQVMARLHETIARHGVADEVFMFICNVQKTGQEHSEAELLASYFHMKRFPWKRKRSDGRRYEMERENYIFCLESAARYNTEYVLLLQDDALPHGNFYEVLDYLLRSRLERTVSRGRAVGGAKDWAWLKLNFPDELADFHRNPFFACELIALSLALAGATAVIYHVICTKRVSTVPSKLEGKSPRQRHHAAVNLLFVLSFLYTLLASCLIGRPYFLRLYGLSKYFARLTPGTSCCLPAMVFPQEQVHGLVQYLSGVKCRPGFPLDFALDAYREQTQLRQYLAVPNLFSHIGYYSALHSGTNSISAYAYLDC